VYQVAETRFLIALQSALLESAGFKAVRHNTRAENGFLI